MSFPTPRTDAAPKIQPHPSGGFFVAVELAEALESELGHTKWLLDRANEKREEAEYELTLVKTRTIV
jgi:hypothetical protein